MKIPTVDGRTITPAEANYIYHNGNLDSDGVMSAVLNLAENGALSIGKIPAAAMFDKFDYELRRRGDSDAFVKATLLDRIFEKYIVTTTEELYDEEFGLVIEREIRPECIEYLDKKFENVIRKDDAESRLERQRPRSNTGLLITLVLLISVLALYATGIIKNDVLVTIGYILGFVVMILAARFVFYASGRIEASEENILNENGKRLQAEVTAFRDALASGVPVADEEFNMLLPYAMALGVGKEFCAPYADIDLTAPAWWVRQYRKGIYCGDWNGNEALDLLNTLSDTGHVRGAANPE